MKQGRTRHLAAILITSFIPHIVLTSPVFVQNLLSEGSGRNIRHLPCISRKTGETGICMFAFTCAKANGTHLGTCIDRFYFGSCCKINEELEIVIQDNSIEIDNPMPLLKPYITTTTTHTLESNDIPGNVDKLKPFINPTFGTVGSTIKAELTTISTFNSIKQQSSKATIRIPDFSETNTEATKISTFQTVQNLSAQRFTSTLMDRISESHKQSINIDLKSTTVKPRSTSMPSLSSSIIDNIISSSTYRLPTTLISPSLFSLPSSSFSISTVSQQYNPSTKPFIIQEITKKPTSMNESAVWHESIKTTNPRFNSTLNRNITNSLVTLSTHKTPLLNEYSNNMSTITTQKTSSITRFPPRNTTISPSTLKINSTSNPSTATNSIDQNYDEIQKPLTTKKSNIVMKPFRTSTKRYTTTKKPSSLIATIKPTIPDSITIMNVNFSKPVFDIFNFNSTLRKGIPIAVTSPVSASPTTSINLTDITINSTNFSSNLVSTKKPYVSASSRKPTLGTTKKPLLPITVKKVQTTPRSTSSTLKRNLTSSTYMNSTNVSSTKFSFTSEKPITLFSKNDSEIIINVSATHTTNKSSILKTTDSKSNIIKTTEKPTSPLLINLKSTTASSADSSTKPASLLITDSAILFNINNEINETEAQSQTVTVHANLSTAQNWIDSSLSTSTVSNEINLEFGNGTDQINMTPGIITWTSLIGNIENSTKNPEYSSNVLDFSTRLASITTNEWITLQPPTTQAHDLEIDMEIKPFVSTTQISISPAKPVTESTIFKETTPEMIQQFTTQTTRFMDILSTLASVTLSPDFTEPSTLSINMSNFKEVCGRRLFPEPRIVGGDGSTFGKWPWQISLRQWRTSTYLHKCGAALLNENWAITAAHCVQNVLPTDLLLRIGEHDLANEEEPYGFQERRVQIVASHPNFDPRTFEFDLALMRFYEPILPFQPNVLPICIPDDDEGFVGQTAFVTGWGRLYEDGPLPSVLQEVAVPVINNSICEGMYRNAGYIEHIPHIFICAGWRKGGFDSCEGDSGGPLVIQRKRDKRWVLAGVISWGIGCAEPNQPGVYTRISEFREWINQILQF